MAPTVTRPATLDKCFSPTRLNGLPLRNRIIRAATFEGMTPGGMPGKRLAELHCDAARGGVAMTTIAYCAVDPDGRIMNNMLTMDEGIRGPLQQLIDQVHAAGAAVSGQLGHCGNFSQNKDFRGSRPLGPSPMLNIGGLPYGLLFAGAMTQANMDQLVQNFHDTAAFMQSVGFDALELHFGHGYALSQFISPRTNKRSDAYGGSLFNRMRLPLRVLEAVRKAVGDDFPILGKMGLTDGVKGGLKIDGALQVAELLDQAGIDCLIPSGGTSSMNPMLLFRGDSLLQGMLENETSRLMRLGLRWFGPRLFKHYPYQELYFLDGAKRVRDRVQCKVCYIGGVSTAASMETAIQEFDLIQIGRALINDPALVKHAAADRHYVNACNHCNRCVTMIKNPEGIHCVLNNPDSERQLAKT